MTHYSTNGTTGVLNGVQIPFLVLYNTGCQFSSISLQGYSSINAYRSAISSVHENVDGHTIGQHPLICRLVKGVFQTRPLLPCYSQTWDVQKVLQFLDTLEDNQTLLLKHLS